MRRPTFAPGTLLRAKGFIDLMWIFSSPTTSDPLVIKAPGRLFTVLGSSFDVHGAEMTLVLVSPEGRTGWIRTENAMEMPESRR